MSKYYRKFVQPTENFINRIYYKAKIDSFEVLNLAVHNNSEVIVFAGDSIIQNFPLDEIYPDHRVLNRGLEYDTSFGMLKRLNATINNLRISKLFIMIGHNDLKYRSVKNAAENIDLLFSRIDAEKCFFLSILPCAIRDTNRSFVALNTIINKRCKERGIKYIDCYSLFVDERGEIMSEYFFDETHLNMNGYIRLDKKIRPIIIKPASDQDHLGINTK